MKTTTTRRLGATDAAPLLGLGRWGNQRDVWERIVNGKHRPESAAMRRGTLAEPRVRELYVEQTGAELMVLPSKVFEHPRLEFATCSPDAIRTDGVLVELKTANRWGKSWKDGVPVDYVCQVLWSLWVLDLERAHLFVAFGEDKGGEFEITSTPPPWEFRRDAEMEARFEGVGRRFWFDHVVTRVPPSGA